MRLDEFRDGPQEAIGLCRRQVAVANNRRQTFVSCMGGFIPLVFRHHHPQVGSR